jgi:predicted ribosome quality control (RQC) complex YloA/Tae2 family protein
MPFDGIVTRAVTAELNRQLTPGKITKIYQPTTTELVFTIRSHGKNHSLLFSIHPAYARFHITAESFQNPREAPMFCMVLRKHILGAQLKEIKQYGMERIVSFHIQARNEIGDISNKTLMLELMGKHSNVMLLNDGDMIIDSLKHISVSQNRHRTILPGNDYLLPPMQDKLNPLEIDGEQFIRKLDFNGGKLEGQIVNHFVGFSPFIAKEIVSRAKLGNARVYMEKFLEIQELIHSHRYEPSIYRDDKDNFHVIPITFLSGEKEIYSSASSMLDQFFSGKAERDRVKQQTKDLYRFIKNEKDKNVRKMKKHRQTLKKAENKDHYQKMGELLTAHMHLVSQGDSHVTVTDYYDPQQGELTIDLNPNKTPSENAQSFYKTYQKLKTSKDIIDREIVKTKREITYLEQLLQQIEVANMEDIEEIREELREEGYLKKQIRQKKGKNKPKLPVPEKYTASDGTTILVGKNNKQNEYVTAKLAHKEDTWLHTKDIPGSHVIIRSSDPSEETLLEAAVIAAYYSKSQQSSSVPVDYTKVKHVRKPNGAKPGYVIYDNQKTVFVTPEKKIVDLLRSGK